MVEFHRESHSLFVSHERHHMQVKEESPAEPLPTPQAQVALAKQVDRVSFGPFDGEEETNIPSVAFQTVTLTPRTSLKEKEESVKEKRKVAEEYRPHFAPSPSEGFKPSRSLTSGAPHAKASPAEPAWKASGVAVRSRGASPFGSTSAPPPSEITRVVPSRPIKTSFGVSVDFAGQLEDNPLYRQDNPAFHGGNSQTRNNKVFERDVVTTNVVHMNGHPVNDNFFAAKPQVSDDTPQPPSTTSKPFQDTLSQKPKTTDEEDHDYYRPIPQAPATSTLRNPFTTTSTETYYEPIVVTPVYQPKPIGQFRPSSKAILKLSASGPSSPLFNELIDDFSRRVPRPKWPKRRRRQRPRPLRFPPPRQYPSPEDGRITSRVSYVFNKLAGGHVGDRSFDGYDWLPLLAVILAGGLILAGAFPNGINNFGLTNGNLVLAREREGRVIGPEEDVPGALDAVMRQLESSILLVGGLRAEEDGCAERLACKLGGLARTGFRDADLVTGALNLVMPSKYANFTRSFERALRDDSCSGCQSAECSRRCVEIA